MLRGLKDVRRVVITGLGCVTPLGVGREAFWDGLRRGASGVRRIEGFDVSASPVQIAGQVRGFEWERELKAKDRRHVPRTVPRSEEHTSELQSRFGISYAVFCFKKKTN